MKTQETVFVYVGSKQLPDKRVASVAVCVNEFGSKMRAVSLVSNNRRTFFENESELLKSAMDGMKHFPHLTVHINDSGKFQGWLKSKADSQSFILESLQKGRIALQTISDRSIWKNEIQNELVKLR